MPATFRFALNDLPPEAEGLRAEVREFLKKEFSGAAPVKRRTAATSGRSSSATS